MCFSESRFIHSIFIHFSLLDMSCLVLKFSYENGTLLDRAPATFLVTLDILTLANHPHLIISNLHLSVLVYQG